MKEQNDCGLRLGLYTDERAGKTLQDSGWSGSIACQHNV